ncbi:MAG: 16S rRNA (guanine(527)-N(7))-methyltransferase RsmG [Symploca sp. SIO2G7]|nr:16S rRNA (guanine(527)-N(7))-methyltransferase RsmG [Symploca sp. SIO2G7]
MHRFEPVAQIYFIQLASANAMKPSFNEWSDSVQIQARERLVERMRSMAFKPEPEQVHQLIEYAMLMSRWNRAYNLTAVREPMAIVERHLLDSLSIASWIAADTVLDAGTGAGLPGIPLAVVDRGREFVLVDSNGKKIRFVREAVRRLGLNHVRPLQARLESLDAAYENTSVDIVCRALASLDQLIEWSAAWLGRGARLLAMKAAISDSERSAVPAHYNVKIEALEAVHSAAQARNLVIVSRR